VKEGGHTFGQDPTVLARLVKAVRAATTLPLIVKLAPNVPDIAPYAAACADNGADALALINTIPAMVIDIETRRPVLGNRTGGLSGRCVHPVAVKAVYDAHRCSRLPILAMGGVYEAKDAIELMLAGATAVAVGTATFTTPETAARMLSPESATRLSPKSKFDRNHTTIVAIRMIENARWIKSLLFSHNNCPTFFALGKR
jgi:dihydroorotate dehydrogenase (NAD+) catalytic subunit